jgi:hypothetical protein
MRSPSQLLLVPKLSCCWRTRINQNGRYGIHDRDSRGNPEDRARVRPQMRPQPSTTRRLPPVLSAPLYQFVFRDRRMHRNTIHTRFLTCHRRRMARPLRDTFPPPLDGSGLTPVYWHFTVSIPAPTDRCIQYCLRLRRAATPLHSAAGPHNATMCLTSGRRRPRHTRQHSLPDNYL